MQYFVILLILLIKSTLIYPEIVNWVIAKVGNYPITYYDLNQMNEFVNFGSGLNKNADLNQSFEDLILTYCVLTIPDFINKIKINETEIDNYINSMTNISNSNDPTFEYKLTIFNKYPEQFKLQLKKNQIIRNLIFYDENLKSKINKEITPLEITNFYEKNKKNFEVPMISLLILAVEQNKNLSFDEMLNFEKVLNEIKEIVKKTNDINFIIDKYKDKIKFEDFSQITEFKSVYELLDKGIPDEILNLSLMEKIRLPDGSFFEIKKDAVFGPQIIPIKKMKKNVYIIIKFLENPKKTPLPLEKILDKIDYAIKEERINNEIKKYVLENIKKGKITINIIDKKYEEVYNDFLRR